MSASKLTMTRPTPLANIPAELVDHGGGNYSVNVNGHSVLPMLRIEGDEAWVPVPGSEGFTATRAAVADWCRAMYAWSPSIAANIAANGALTFPAAANGAAKPARPSRARNRASGAATAGAAGAPKAAPPNAKASATKNATPLPRARRASPRK